MKLFKLAATIPALALVFSAGVAGATTTFDANVTPDVIFGSGNANGGFTVVQQSNVEIGLRAKLRYNLSGSPENTFNSNGDGTYSFDPAQGNPPVGRSIFNFEWSLNSDLSGTGGTNLDAFDYLLSIDLDPTAGTATTVDFDPINLAFADHAIGTNATGNGGGTEAANTTEYLNLIANNNVAQNSWNLGFFSPPGFDPQTPGIYTISLDVLGKGTTNQFVARSSIDITVAAVPLPAAGWLLLSAFAGLGLAARRRRRAA